MKKYNFSIHEFPFGLRKGKYGTGSNKYKLRDFLLELIIKMNYIVV